MGGSASGVYPVGEKKKDLLESETEKEIKKLKNKNRNYIGLTMET